MFYEIIQSALDISVQGTINSHVCPHVFVFLSNIFQVNLDFALGVPYAFMETWVAFNIFAAIMAFESLGIIKF